MFSCAGFVAYNADGTSTPTGSELAHCAMRFLTLGFILDTFCIMLGFKHAVLTPPFDQRTLIFKEISHGN